MPTCFHMIIPKPCQSVRPSVRIPRNISPWLRQYQSYISNWYINGKVFMSTTTWKLKYLIFFFLKFEIEFCLVFWLALKSWNRLSFVNISPTLVIDASMERSLQVQQHGNPKIWFFSKSSYLYFNLCQRAEINIQVGLNMHLYNDIGMHRRPFEGRHLVQN